MRAITGSLAWATAAFWCAFIGVTLSLVSFVPLLVDWLALDRGARARRARFPSLLLHALAIVAFIASVTLRLRARGALSPLAFTLADAGVTLLAVAALLTDPRYQPIGLPFNSPSSHASSGLK